MDNSGILKVAVLSDTHMPANAPALPAPLTEALKGADFILHAGDFTEEYVITELEKIAPLICVAGNMDSPAIKRKYPVKRIVNIGNFRLGLIHGCGAPDKVIDYAMEIFKGENLDCIVHGHSHIPAIESIGNALYVCPGSPTDQVFAPYNSYIVLELGSQINPKIIRL
ncbi:MAG: YfcE family phosphodiesterase [Candidatus Omnitrophica bacterium]|jgi:hypothetical protein|nr:YfcE family phosphodiesterase [Candidatus Omnitrophota bacterium]